MLRPYKNCVWFCAIFYVVYVENVKVIEQSKLYKFETKPTKDGEKDAYKENYININVNKHGIPFKSISCCLRFAPKDLYSQCLFYEEGFKLIFIDQNKNYGFLFFHGIYYIFKFPEETPIVPEEWYHVCVSYEQKNSTTAQIKMLFNRI